VAAVAQHRHAARAVPHRQPGELVGAVAGQGPKPVRQREVCGGEEVMARWVDRSATR
jgi:hypothetical protein